MASNLAIPEGFELIYTPDEAPDNYENEYQAEIPKGFELVDQQNKNALESSLKELPEDDPYVQSQKYQTEQLANMLFTQDELKAIEQQGEIGWVEYRSRGFVGWSDIMPVVGTAKQAYKAGKTYTIAKKLENGEEVSDADKAYMKEYLRNYVELSKRGMSWSAKGASMFVQAPAFMVEFALTGGLGEVAAKGALKAATKGATNLAVKGATKTAARIAGQEAVLVPLYATANYNERKIADGLNITDKGDMIFDSVQAESNNKANALKAFGTAEIQIASELSGGLIGKMFSGIGGAAAKGFSKVASTNTARGISATSAKLYNSLPKNVRVKLEASARVAEKLWKSAAETGEKMKSKGLEFHGVAEEMGEERVGDILMTAFDLDDKEGYSKDQWLNAIFPSPQQLLLEAGVFSIVGATSLATRTVANDLMSKGYSEKEATTISQNLSEIEKENMANEILGEVKINEDITEEEVQQEADAIQAKLFGGVEMNVNNADRVKEDIASNEAVQRGLSVETALAQIDKLQEGHTYKINNAGVMKFTGQYNNEGMPLFESVSENKGNTQEISLTNKFDDVTESYDLEDNNKKTYNSYNDFVKEFSNNAEEIPEDYQISDAKEAMKDLGVTEESPRIIQTPIEKLQLRADRLEHIINGGGDGHLPDKTRYKSINKMFATLERPDLIIQFKDGKKDYLKIFKSTNNAKNQIVVIHNDENGDFIYTSMPVNKDKKYILREINKGEIIYKKGQTGAKKSSAANNSITDNAENLNPSVKNNELYDISEEAPKKQPKTLKEVEEIADKEVEKEEEKTGLKGLYSDFKQAFSEFIEPFYTETVDRFAPIQNTVKRANKKGANLGIEITDKNWSENPYNLARMYSGLANRIWQHFKENTMARAEDGTQKITGEGFGKIIEDLYKQTNDIESNKETQLKDFEDYLIAKRFLLDLKDREGYEATEEQKLKAIQDMARLVEKYGQDMSKLEKLADRVYEYNRRTLHLLVDSGNMSQETYDKIIEQNPHHISYKRVMDENYGTGGLSFAKGKFTDAKSPIKKIRGSEREIQSIYKSTLEDTMRIIDVAERNTIARQVAELKKYLPEEIKPIKPKMEKRTAKVKVTYDAKMRQQLLEAINFFGRTFENVKSIKTPTGYALGSYSEEEQIVRKKLGSQDRTLAHEVGHMLDYALDVENQIKNNSAIMNEIKTLAEDRFESIIKLQDGEFVTEEGGSTEKYKRYAKTNKEMIANAFDLYFTSRDYVKRVAPETAKFIDNLFKGKYKFLNEIRPSSETATEEIEQDVWTPSNRKPSDNSIGYYEDGKIKFVEVEPSLMRSVEDLNPKQYGMIAQAVDKVFKTSSDWLRAGATLNPEFILRNPIRDVQEAWFNVKGFNPIIDVPKGLMAVLGKGNSKLYKEWQREGGAFNSYMELNEKSINEAIKLYEDKKPLIWKALGFVPNTLEKLSSTLEESTRLGIYNAMLRKGLTPTQAAFMSREGTLDFARGGRFIKQANRYLTFLNAGVQGTDRVLRTIINNPKQALKVGMTMAAAQILLSGYYLFPPEDDEERKKARDEYLEIPEYVKNVAYVFKVGDKWLKIPRPFAPGYIFEAIPEKFVTWLATKDKPEGLELYNFAKDLFTSASPITDFSDFFPPALKVLIENTANYNFFTGRQIYPDYLNQYSPKERYNKNTSETAKLLGEKLNMSPALIENALRGQFGNAAKYTLDAGDWIQDNIKQLTGEEVNERPKDISNAWVVRGFTVKDPIGNQSQSVNTFYKNYKELSEVHNDYNKLKKESRQEAREYKEKHKEELSQYKKINKANDDIKDLRKDINKILKDTKLNGEEKTKKIKLKEAKMTEIAKKANEDIKE